MDERRLSTGAALGVAIVPLLTLAPLMVLWFWNLSLPGYWEHWADWGAWREGLAVAFGVSLLGTMGALYGSARSERVPAVVAIVVAALPLLAGTAALRSLSSRGGGANLLVRSHWLGQGFDALGLASFSSIGTMAGVALALAAISLRGRATRPRDLACGFVVATPIAALAPSIPTFSTLIITVWGIVGALAMLSTVVGTARACAEPRAAGAGAGAVLAALASLAALVILSTSSSSKISLGFIASAGGGDYVDLILATVRESAPVFVLRGAAPWAALAVVTLLALVALGSHRQWSVALALVSAVVVGLATVGTTLAVVAHEETSYAAERSAPWQADAPELEPITINVAPMSSAIAWDVIATPQRVRARGGVTLDPEAQPRAVEEAFHARIFGHDDPDSGQWLAIAVDRRLSGAQLRMLLASAHRAGADTVYVVARSGYVDLAAELERTPGGFRYLPLTQEPAAMAIRLAETPREDAHAVLTIGPDGRATGLPPSACDMDNPPPHLFGDVYVGFDDGADAETIFGTLDGEFGCMIDAYHPHITVVLENGVAPGS